MQRLRQYIGEAAWASLYEQRIDPKTFLWFVQVTKAQLREAALVDGGVLAASGDDQIHYWRYTALDGFQMTSASRPAVTATAVLADDRVELRMTFPEESAVANCLVTLNAGGVGMAGGAWFEEWRKPCARAIGWDGPPESICLVSLRVVAPEQNGFGVRLVTQHAATLLAVEAADVSIVPALDITALKPLSWWADDNRVEIMQGGDAERQAVVIDFSLGRLPMEALGRFVDLLPGELRTSTSVVSSMQRMGVFPMRLSSDTASTPRLLEQTDTGIIAHTDPPLALPFGTLLGEILVLATETGVCASLETTQTGRDALLRSVKPIGTLLPGKNSDQKWAVTLREVACQRTPVCITVSPGALDIDGNIIIPFESAGEASVATDSGKALAVLSLKWQQSGTQRFERLLASTEGVYALWEEWEVGRTKSCVSRMTFPDLYRLINTDRRHEFLLAMYGNILLLNRTLESGIPISDLVQRLAAQGAVKFAEDQTLRNETLTKIITLLEAINQMRQRAEIFASLYPYYWAQQEADWMTHVFGPRAAAQYVVQERKTVVPALRRQIRGIQSELFRTLVQIEAGSKPIEALLGKEEIRRHWSTKARMILPGAANAGIGAIMMMTTGGMLGLTMLASAITIHGLGSILNHFQQDREGAAQIIHSAESILPWWHILMETLPVSIYESGQFLDEENLRVMKRDRAFVDSLEPQHRQEVLERLRKHLMTTLIMNRRKTFCEMTQGSCARVADLFADIEQVSTKQMRDNVKAFVSSMSLTPQREGVLHG